MEKSFKSQVKIEDFETLRLIGKGEYGKVLLVRKLSSGELLAMKIIKKKLIEAKNQVEHTKAERSILEKATHPYIVRLRYAFHTNLKLYMAMEYCPGGELYFHLSKYKRFSEDRAKFYASCIVLALNYLHESNVVYRDLKPENIVLDSEGYPKITDFGLAKENISMRDLTKTVCGTPEYIAPEIILRQGHGHAVDWWSLGCIIYEMLIGIPPFYMEERKDIYKNIVQRPVRFLIPINPLAADLITKLLHKDPAQRLGTRGGQEVMNHRWFQNTDWDALYRRELKPVFVPSIKNPIDTRYFSEDFTQSSIAESPNYDETFASSPTFGGFSFTADRNSCTMELDQEIVNY